MATAYESQSRISVPDDFQAALYANPAAQEFFDQLNRANRYAILYRITTAKKAETRQKRIDKFIAMLNANEKLYD